MVTLLVGKVYLWRSKYFLLASCCALFVAQVYRNKIQATRVLYTKRGCKVLAFDVVDAISGYSSLVQVARVSDSQIRALNSSKLCSC